MDYASPRFQGDQHLVDILNDPDTGNVKLGPGSPSASIQKVQQALEDLDWPAQAEPQIDADQVTFSDGIWGPNTENAILAYKFAFQLRFPPGAFPGLLDGFAGPRTMFLLDFHVVAFDAAVAAIDAKVADLTANGRTVTDETTSGPLSRTRIVTREMSVDGTPMTIAHHPDLGAFLIGSPIVDHWLDRLIAFGAPTGDEHDVGGGARQVEFQFGTLEVDAAGAVSVVGERTTPDLVY
jgi:peptidoglycan hydrolase-like protein with peptidoglycan-binding domain